MCATRLWRLALMALLLGGPGACSDPPPAADGCPEPRALARPAADPRAGDGLWLIEAGRPARSVSVLRLFSHPRAAVRARAALAAGRIAAPALSRELPALLGDEDAAVRAAAAWALGLADHARAEDPLLVRVALDDDEAVRVTALRSLGLVGGAASARALLGLVADLHTPSAVRAQTWRSLALLARRGSTLTHPAAPLALARLAAPDVPADERRAAAYLLATLVDRSVDVRKALTAKHRATLRKIHAAQTDPETRAQLARAVIRLRLVDAKGLAALAGAGGTPGRLALEALTRRDAVKGEVLGPLVDGWVRALPAAACRTVTPVMLWQALGALASTPRPRRGWVAGRAPAWLQGVRAAQKQAAAGSCAAHQLGRLACRAAALADVSRGRLEHLEKCGGGALSVEEERAFLAWGLARGVVHRPFAHLRRLWLQGGVRTRAAVLTASGRLGGNLGHALAARGLAARDLTIFGAAATACGELLKPGRARVSARASASARSSASVRASVRVSTGARARTRAPKAAPVRQTCQMAARQQLLALKMPPTFAELPRWLELVRLVQNVADNAVVERLKAAADHHHPTLRQLARATLAATLGRPPGPAPWPGDDRRSPAEPLTAPVTLTLHTGAGPVTLRLRPDWAPVTAGYFLGLVRRGAYRKSSFHRVVPGFVVQGGDPTGTGFGGDATFLLSEPSAARFHRGVVGLAHAGKDTESSQLFITLGPAPHLDGRYTAFAEVTAGIEAVERLVPGAPFHILPPPGLGALPPPTRPRPTVMSPPQTRPVTKPVMKPTPTPPPMTKPKKQPVKKRRNKRSRKP